MRSSRGRLARPGLAMIGMAMLCALASRPVEGQAYVEFDDHWLAAACAQAPINGRLAGAVVTTEYGIAVEARRGTSVVLHCNVEPDLFHNLIQVIAEDNHPDNSVTATFLRQPVDNPGPPEEIVSVETSDQEGLQQAEFFFDPPFESPNELVYMYFVRIVMVRGAEDPLRVYSVSMRDVL